MAAESYRLADNVAHQLDLHSRLETIKWALCGALVGVLLLHPLIMILGNMMRQEALTWESFLWIVGSEYMRSFTLHMMPWTLGFAGAGALAGTLYARVLFLAKSLKHREQLFRLITNSARDAILMFDEEGGAYFVNPATSKILGYSPQDYPDPSLGEFLESQECSPPSGKQGTEQYSTKWTSFREGPFETSIRTKDDRLIPVEVNLGNTEQEGSRKVVAVVRDVSERKRLERLREDTERILRHDLKAPLNTIVGFSRMLTQQNVVDPGEAGETILQQAERMLHMLDHSLDLFRIEEGSYELRPEWFDLEPVLQRQARAHGALKRSRNLTVHLEVQCKAGRDYACPIRGNLLHIETIVSNLLQNALEASPRDDTVSLSAYSTLENRIVITFHNSGQIPPQIKDHFFEPYVKCNKPNGTGLGTYSARLLARAHKGDIKVTSSSEEGTVVQVVLPQDPDNEQ